LQFVMAFNALLEREPEVIGKIWFCDEAYSYQKTKYWDFS
jgi:hypothetical protein